VHALDIAKSIACALEAPRDIVHNQVFNVGDTANNYRVKEIAEIIASVFKGCQLSFGDSGSDNRSYRVSFEKINTQLPGFKCDWNAERGAQQLFDLFTRIDMTQEVFESRGFTRLKQLEYLIRTQQIDKDFFWSK
jgi:nucleoside-diphosphate-sugar epimerase